MTTADTRDETVRGLSLPGRLLGVLVAPRATFGRIVDRPTWLGPLAAVVLVQALAQGLFLTTEVGREALVAQQVRTLESFGVTVTEEMYATFERSADFAGYLQPLSVIAFGSLMIVALTGLLYAVFTIVGGRPVSFRQVFAIVATSGGVVIVQQLFVMPLNYVRRSMSNPATLAAFIPMLDEDTFLVRFLGVVDVFIVWWIVVVSIGLAVVYRRRAASIGAGLMTLYLLVAAVVALVGIRMGGASS